MNLLFWRNRIFLPHQDQAVIQQQYPSLGLLLCQEPIHCIRRQQINNRGGLLAEMMYCNIIISLRQATSASTSL